MDNIGHLPCVGGKACVVVEDLVLALDLTQTQCRHFLV